MATKLKIDDIVWVNERNVMGKILKHEWKGRILKIDTFTGIASVRDLDDKTIYQRFALCLEKVVDNG